MSALTKLRLRNIFDMSSRSNADAQDLQATTESVGATPIRECDRGKQITACGILKSVVVRPRAGTPTLEAELYDGSGSLTLVWLGQRRITGIEVGKSLIVEGKLTCDNEHFTLFNPRYQLRPLGVT